MNSDVRRTAVATKIAKPRILSPAVKGSAYASAIIGSLAIVQNDKLALGLLYLWPVLLLFIAVLSIAISKVIVAPAIRTASGSRTRPSFLMYMVSVGARGLLFGVVLGAIFGLNVLIVFSALIPVMSILIGALSWSEHADYLHDKRPYEE